MLLTTADWLVVAVYFVISTVVGLLYARRAGKSSSEFFTAGRSLPWWLAGTSMVATTFAADTPLAVTGLVAAHGVAGNWVWWNMVAGGCLTVFVFAKLWHRAEVQTDTELTELRYRGRPAAILRVFRALYLALPINLIIMGWVNLAMMKILAVIFPGVAFELTLGMLALTGIYALISGLWGVVVTDALQFCIAMGGSVALAVIAVEHSGGLSALGAAATEHFGSREHAVGFFPQLGGEGAWMPLWVFLTYLTVQWWATWYPGAEPGGGGYIAQRIFSARSERDGMLATLWFTIAHYAVRPWPWILTALAVVVAHPNATDPASLYVGAVVEWLPSPLRGLLLASFAAAYMSTLSTQLNWGASYLLNDVYKKARPAAGEREAVWVSRAATLVLLGLSMGATVLLQRVGSVEGAWRVLIALGAGTGAVYLLRWFWWRINAWTEIAAMTISAITFLSLTTLGIYDPGDSEGSAALMLVTTAVTTVGWLLVTLLSKPEPLDHLAAFYMKVRPGGPGWGPVLTHLGLPRLPLTGERGALWRFAGAVAVVYSALFGVGELLLGSTSFGAALLVGGAGVFFWLAR